jgi:LacI family transcriptional regulator
VSIVSLLSELSAAGCRGHVGINNRSAGRTAGWAVAHCARAPGPVGVLIGSHGYPGQEDREIGLRSYLRERAPQFHVVEPIVCLDDPELAAAGARELVAGALPLAALYVAGGGEAGAIRVLETMPADVRPPCICHEVAPHTRNALAAGIVAVAIAQDTRQIAQHAVAQLIALARGDDGAAGPQRLPFTIHTSENV